MLAEDLFGLRRTLDDHGTLFAYSGYVTDNVRIAVGETIKQRLMIEDTDTKTIRSVFAVFVEQMQNVIRYSAETARSTEPEDGAAFLRYGILTIGRGGGDDYVVLSGNMIQARDVERVRGRLEEVSGLDRGALKALYKERLREGPDEHSKGAGVGLIEIARRASRPVEFDVHEVDEKWSFVAIKATI